MYKIAAAVAVTVAAAMGEGIPVADTAAVVAADGKKTAPGYV